MPRLQPILFRQAKRRSPLLATLLPACKDIETARNELRWLRNHVDDTYQVRKAARLVQLCRQRGQGLPLQYTLGSQPFGSLDIRCRPGVLIPRPETEAYTCHLVDLIRSGVFLGKSYQGEGQSLRIVDFCTGTGCIPLLLFHSLQKFVGNLEVQGVDVSPMAVRLAQENIAHNSILDSSTRSGLRQRLTILEGNIFSDKDMANLATSRWDIVVSNPPYISRDVWNHGRGQLAYSVRKYEPRLALIPHDDLPRPVGCRPEDAFYARLLDVAWALGAKIILLEIGDEPQARRVLELYSQHTMADDTTAELWRDWPDSVAGDDDEPNMFLRKSDGRVWSIPVKGTGLIRSIVVRRSDDGDAN